MGGMIRFAVFGLLTTSLVAQQWKPAERLEAERKEIRAAYEKPWHRIVSFQLYDTMGKPSRQGSVEDFFYSPFQQKRVFSLGKDKAVIYTVGDGAFSEKKNPGIPIELAIALKSLNENGIPLPLPGDRLMAQGSLFNSALSCFSTQRSDATGHFAVATTETPTICFEPDSGKFRAMQIDQMVTAVNNTVSFRSHEVPAKVSLFNAVGKIADLTVSTLEPLSDTLAENVDTKKLHQTRSTELVGCSEGGLRPQGNAQTDAAKFTVFVHVTDKGKADSAEIFPYGDVFLEDLIERSMKHQSFTPCMVNGKAEDYTFVTSFYQPGYDARTMIGSYSRYSDPRKTSSIPRNGDNDHLSPPSGGIDRAR